MPYIEPDYRWWAVVQCAVCSLPIEYDGLLLLALLGFVHQLRDVAALLHRRLRLLALHLLRLRRLQEAVVVEDALDLRLRSGK